MALGCQQKINHKICGISLDCGSEIVQEYELRYNDDYK